MSLTLFPPILRQYSPWRVGDQRPRSGSFATDLGTDTITGTPTVTITRQDGVTMGAGDLAIIGQPTVDTTKQIVTAVFAQGAPAVVYIVTFAIVTTAGNDWTRDVLFPVVPYLS